MTVYADKQQHSQEKQRRKIFLFGCKDLEQMEVIRVLVPRYYCRPNWGYYPQMTPNLGSCFASLQEFLL